MEVFDIVPNEQEKSINYKSFLKKPKPPVKSAYTSLQTSYISGVEEEEEEEEKELNINFENKVLFGNRSSYIDNTE